MPSGKYTCPVILNRFGLVKGDNLTNAGEALFGNTHPVTLKAVIFATDEKLTRIVAEGIVFTVQKLLTECVNDFVGELNPNTAGLGKKLFTVWHWQVFNNGGKHNSAIRLRKKDIIWPILVKVTEDNTLT